jgi:hypothetical protein
LDQQGFDYAEAAQRGEITMSSQTITFRPAVTPVMLEHEAKRRHFKNKTEFINAAILEKLGRDEADPLERELIATIRSAAYKFVEKRSGWTFKAPSHTEASEIRKGVRDMKSGKVKTISSRELLKRLEKQ